MAFLEIGEPLLGSPDKCLTIPAAFQTFLAIDKHSCFELIRFARIGVGPDSLEAIIVDVENHEVPTHNHYGIRFRERLALCFIREQDHEPEVLPLRDDFPPGIHQNLARTVGRTSLCLSDDNWAVTRRSWTPQKHLARILWWLTSAATGRLHAPDQSVEQLYYRTNTDLVLPCDFDERCEREESLELMLDIRGRSAENRGLTLVAGFPEEVSESSQERPVYDCILLSTPPVVHGFIERPPDTIAELENALRRKNVSIQEQLIKKVKDKFAGNPVNIEEAKKRPCVLLVCTPIKREQNGAIERISKKAFICHSGAVSTGLAARALYQEDWKVYVDYPFGEVMDAPDWDSIRLFQIEISSELTPGLARLHSGIEDEGPKGAIVGLGAVGSSLAMQWIRSGWGQWTFVDNDHLKPHNFVRHEAYPYMVGFDKAATMASLAKVFDRKLEVEGRAIVANGAEFANPNLLAALKNADIVVDASADIEYALSHALQDDLPRGISVFLNLTGNDSVMLAEDSNREIRFDSIEAQYYRYILNATWGDEHASLASRAVRTGAGCRDVSTIIGGDMINLHSSILARSLRQQTKDTTAAIRIWRCNPNNLSVAAESVPVNKPLIFHSNSFSVIWDEGLQDIVQQLRRDALPNETGGVLLGIYDLLANRINVVDALPAPVDSDEQHSSFQRGVIGVTEAIERASLLTGGRVCYIGEWHSHPDGAGSSMSNLDRELFKDMKVLQHEDGLPAVMMIVGETEINVIVGEIG